MGDLRLSDGVPIRLMVMDACVLIDYMYGEPDLFRLIHSHIGQIYVATPVLEEVDSVTSIDELKELGLEPIEPEIEDVFEAGEMEGRTSFQDNICYLTAKRHKLTCVTNDKNLRTLCETSDVPILWGLELILSLVKKGGLTKKEAFHIAEEIHKSNPRHINATVLNGFKAKLKKL